jgi:hypothetical protein
MDVDGVPFSRSKTPDPVWCDPAHSDGTQLPDLPAGLREGRQSSGAMTAITQTTRGSVRGWAAWLRPCRPQVLVLDVDQRWARRSFRVGAATLRSRWCEWETAAASRRRCSSRMACEVPPVAAGGAALERLRCRGNGRDALQATRGSASVQGVHPFGENRQQVSAPPGHAVPGGIVPWGSSMYPGIHCQRQVARMVGVVPTAVTESIPPTNAISRDGLSRWRMTKNFW